MQETPSPETTNKSAEAKLSNGNCSGSPVEYISLLFSFSFYFYFY